MFSVIRKMMSNKLAPKALSVRDFPRNRYSVYWEYFINDGKKPVEWEVRFTDYTSGAVVEITKGASENTDQARLDAQDSVINAIEKFKRKD